MASKRAAVVAGKYTPELAARICAELAAGESVKDIARAGIIGEKTVYRWLATMPEFRAAYVKARELGIERHASDIVELADEAPETTEGVAKAKLRIWARQWMLSKLLPKKYGDNLTLSGDAERPLKAELSLEVIGVRAKGAPAE